MDTPHFSFSMWVIWSGSCRLTFFTYCKRNSTISVYCSYNFHMYVAGVLYFQQFIPQLCLIYSS